MDVLKSRCHPRDFTNTWDEGIEIWPSQDNEEGGPGSFGYIKTYYLIIISRDLPREILAGVHKNAEIVEMGGL